MHVVRNEAAEFELLQEMHAEMNDPTRGQPSVSGMIYCLTKSYYEAEMVVPNPDGSIPAHINKKTMMYFVTGLGLEKVILSGRQIAEKGVYDGISWHVDHIGKDGFIEVKSTRGRLPKDGEDLWESFSEGWKKQILSYFKTNEITVGQLAVIHVIPAEFRVYQLAAEQDEIDANWDWIKSRAQTCAEFKESGQPPTPFKYNMDWECRDCAWKALCDARSQGLVMGVTI